MVLNRRFDIKVKEAKKVLWEEMRRTEFAQAVKAQAIVIIPVGSVEQHGSHLPLNTDANIPFEIARRSALAIDDFSVLVTPPIWTGFSPHHMQHPGTITLKCQTLIDVLTQVAQSIHAHGLRKIFFLNGHVGNDVAITACSRKLGPEDGVSTAVGYGYWEMPGLHEIAEVVCETDKCYIGHSGELETSMELYLQPELIDMSAEFYVRGTSGDPSKATADKGERIINAAVTGLISKLRDFHSGKLEDEMVWRKEVPEKENWSWKMM